MSRKHTRAVSLFQYWHDGSTSVEVNPDPPNPAMAIPFHVVIRSEGWIPVSILVFAGSNEHARSRVRQALVICRDRQYTPRRDEDSHQLSARHKQRAQQYIDALDGTGRDGDRPLWVEVRPLDVKLICAEVVWAANGDLL